jgi:hypothetical protein
MKQFVLYMMILGFTVFGCTQESDENAPTSPDSKLFGDYWYRGKAELTSYQLEQARYGEVHRGHAVLIFVTEDFSRSKQVKLDNPASAGDDRLKVMKLNFTKKFNTGIYPYSMMASVFTPIKSLTDPRTLKITNSSQEWCGHTWVQINRLENGYQLQQNSYFEEEGDKTLMLEDAILEDELWTIIRIDPENLPTGKVKLIPGTMFQRLRHTSWEIQIAAVSLQPLPEDEAIWIYKIFYPASDRTLTIFFNKKFPYEIEGWEESYRSGWGSQAAKLTSKATLNKRIMTDYWTKNRLADSNWRKELGLD